MQNLSSPLAPDIWIADMFMTKAVQKGGVVRRSRRDIERFAGIDRFLREIERRGFQAVENGGQIVVFCNREPLRRLA